MKNDEDLERMLARYRPASPPASLRHRVLAIRAPRQVAVSRWVWIAEAAAVLAAIAMHLSATRMVDAITSPLVAAAAEERKSMLIEATNLLGNGELGQRAAEAWLLTSLEPGPSPSQQMREASWLK